MLESLERRLALDASGAISLVADVATTDVNQSVEIDVLANDKGPKLEVTAVGEVANGVAEITDEGTILFTPDEDFEGEVTFEYTAENRFGTEATGEVTVTVENDIPLAAHDRAELDAEGVAVIDVLANDAVSDDETLTVTQINGVDVAVDEEVTVDGGMVVVDENGVITFTADDGFEGRTDFEYTVSDEEGETATATVVVTAADFVNAAPVAEADDLTTATPSLDGESVVIDVLENDVDDDGDPLTVVAIAGEDVSVGDEVEVEGGVVSLNANGTLTFTPDAEFSGDVAFEYTVSDGLDEATASVTLTVEAMNDPPEAVDDEVSVNLDEGEVIIDVLANDTDGEGDELTVTQINGEDVAAGDEIEVDGGVVTINEDGTVTFTANDDFSGETTFEYTVSDGEGEDSATVTVTEETDSPLYNPDAPTDVDGDGRTTVRDLLMVVRALRELGFGELPEDADPEEVGYVDVNNDNLLTVADLVAVARTMRNGHGHDEDGPGNSRNAPGRTGDHPHDNGDDDDDDERGRGNGAQRGRGRGRG